MRILVVGGAGYVGSHAARLLQEAGHELWIYDNLSQGHRAAALPGRLIVADLMDREALLEALHLYDIEAVMHFAAFAQVGESMSDPAKYYRNNVVASLNLLECMRETGVRRIVFSSSTATYGIPDRIPIAEDRRQDPINPYGFSKLVIEHALTDYARAYGFGFAALRYFNAAGASPRGDLGEDHQPESHLIPLALQVALGQRESISIFGDDYPTSDGTCIRDYVHVDDLGAAHVSALSLLTDGAELKLNLGSNAGYSVREVVDACRRVTGRKIPEVVCPRRAGDPPVLIADSSLAQQTLDWRPKYKDIEAMVATAWRWHKTHPRGYEPSAQERRIAPARSEK